MAEDDFWVPVWHFESYLINRDGVVRANSRNRAPAPRRVAGDETIITLRDNLGVSHERPLPELLMTSFEDVFEKEN